MCDAANAMLSVVGVPRRARPPRRTGEGQELWTSLLDGGAVFASDVLLRRRQAARPAQLDQGQHGIGACYRLYETQDGWIQIAAVRDAEWAALGRVLDVDVSASTPSDRAVTESALEARVPHEDVRCSGRARSTTPACRTRSRSTPRAGDRVLFDADNERLGLVAEYEHPIMGKMRQFGELIQFSETPAHVDGPPPRVGEHTREILEWLGRVAPMPTRSTPPASCTGPTIATHGCGDQTRA